MALARRQDDFDKLGILTQAQQINNKVDQILSLLNQLVQDAEEKTVLINSIGSLTSSVKQGLKL